jgi:fido (protein-threonine AMPylation protein)/DNA-binding CsgD family transcriptional regulator
MSKEKWNLELSEYIKQGEPEKKEKAKTWETAIGLQDVDGLKPSEYLLDTAKEHIEGNINIDEAKKRINSYYEQSNERNKEDNTEEADKVSVRIAEILNEKAFNFSPTEMLNIHKRLFTGIYKEAGKYREYNFTKKEWILNDDTVIYSSYETIKETIEYDFNQEKKFSYKDLSLEDSISHLSRFISNIWQVHPFCEGNTRTTAVFLIKYLRTFGFNVNDEIFADNSWYFRNALVRANYKNYEKNVFEDITFLEKFFYNLLTNTKYELKNRYMHIDYKENIEEISANVSSLSLEEQAILNIIKNNPTIKQEDIALQINKSIRTIKNYMSEMKKKGIIERKNGKRDGEWIVLKLFND